MRMRQLKLRITSDKLHEVSDLYAHRITGASRIHLAPHFLFHHFLISAFIPHSLRSPSRPAF